MEIRGRWGVDAFGGFCVFVMEYWAEQSGSFCIVRVGENSSRKMIQEILGILNKKNYLHNP